MIFEGCEKQLNNKDLESFEVALGTYKLPMDFKVHYLKYNGGYPPEEYQYVLGKNLVYTINSFIPIKYGRLPIEKVIDDYKSSGCIFYPKIPFAYDNGGNLFCISVEKEYYGQIYIVLIEKMETPIEFHFVADNFSHFIKTFAKDIPQRKEYKEPYKTHEGKTYTQEEWEAYEQEQWEKYKNGKKK